MANEVTVRFGADITELQSALSQVQEKLDGLGASSQAMTNLAQGTLEAADAAKKLRENTNDASSDQEEESKKIEQDAKKLTKILKTEAEQQQKDKISSVKQAYEEGRITEEEEITQLAAVREVSKQKELAEWRKFLDDKLITEEKFEEESKKIEAKYAAESRRVHDENIDALAKKYESVVAPIGDAMGNVVNQVAFQHKSLKQAVSSALQSIAQSYVSSAARSAASWISHKMAEMTLDKAVTQQTIANDQLKTSSSIGSNAAKTTATVSGVAARKAAESTEDAGFFTRIGQTIARWLGMETSKTAATTTGATERSAAEGQAVIAAVAAAKTEAAGEIPAFSAIAAAGAMASVACIPFYGWAMAPEVGKTTYAQSMAYLPLASAEGGWERVPYDGALTELHKDEMVLPAAIADTVRAASASVGAQGVPRGMNALGGDLAMPNMAAGQAGAHSGSAMTVHYAPQVSSIDTRGARDFLDQHGRYIVDVLSRHHRNFAQGAK